MAAACLAALALLGCGDDPVDPDPPEPSCPYDFLGDPEAEIQIEVTALLVNGSSEPVVEGGTIDVVTPPQGGRVVFAGVRATNLDPCEVTLTGALVDTPSKKLMDDARTINLRPADDGWGSSVDSDITTFANVGVCPNQWSTRDIFEQDYTLIVQVTDRKDRSASKSIPVRPTCAEEGDAGDQCRCMCKEGYVLGEACQ